MKRESTIYALTKYGQNGASSRVRFRNLVPGLSSLGWRVEVIPLLNDDILAKYYVSRRHSIVSLVRCYAVYIKRVRCLPRPALWWVEKELLHGMPAAVEHAVLPALPRAVIDYDDAVYLSYKNDRFAGRAAKFPVYARRAAYVTVGSQYIFSQMREWGAKRLRKIPSTVYVAKYPLHAHQLSRVPVVGWIGTPMTVRFLEELRPVLRELACRLKFKLHVVGASWSCDGVDTVCIPWCETAEADLVSSFDVGIMPLIDGDWEKGKCAYKLIQYMAAGVVPVGSDVGENAEVVRSPECGFTANTGADWLQILERLCRDATLRSEIGRRARDRAKRFYDVSCAVRAVDEVFFESVSNLVWRGEQ